MATLRPGVLGTVLAQATGSLVGGFRRPKVQESYHDGGEHSGEPNLGVYSSGGIATPPGHLFEVVLLKDYRFYQSFSDRVRTSLK